MDCGKIEPTQELTLSSRRCHHNYDKCVRDGSFPYASVISVVAYPTYIAMYTVAIDKYDV